MGRIPEETIQRIMESSNIVEVISESILLKKTGHNYMGVCPFHNDKGPSLSVSSEKQIFHCFGCGASGNVVGFIMKLRNMQFVDSILFLADRAGIKVDTKEETKEEQRDKILKDDIYNINIEAARFFFSNRKNNNVSNDYLDRRKLSNSIINKFGIGYSLNEWNSLLKHLNSKGYNNELILKSGLIIQKEKTYYDRFRNRIMFPVFDMKKRIIGFGGRVLDDSKPKYLNSPETDVFKKGTNLYGLNFAIKSGLPESIIIVEGYMDCISLHQQGITNAVAALGTALTHDHAKILKRFSKNVYICFDADTAGQAATLRGLEILSNAQFNVKIIMIPNGKDPDEYIKNYGVDEFKKLIDYALPITEYKIRKSLLGKNLKNYIDKMKFLNEVSEILSKIQNEIEIYAYAEKILDITGIDVKIILEQVKKIKSNISNNENNIKNIRNNNTNGNIYILEHAYKKSEKNILALAINDKKLFEYIKNKLEPHEFITDYYIKAANIIYENLNSGKLINPSQILLNFQTETEINEVSYIFQDVDINTLKNGYKFIDDYVTTIKKYNLETEINDLTVEIKKSERSNDIVRISQLFQQLVILQKQLKLL